MIKDRRQSMFFLELKLKTKQSTTPKREHIYSYSFNV